MALRYTNENGVEVDKVQKAIDRLKLFEPEEGYYLAFSGGKDSQTIYHLAKDAGVKFDAHYNVTSVDPPELVQFIKRVYPDVSIDIPHDRNGKPITMWSLIATKGMPPTRQVRYCCEKLKEASGKGRITVTGVRWAESVRRRVTHDVVGIRGKRAMAYYESLGGEVKTDKAGKRLIMNDDNDTARRTVEHCYRTAKTLLNPIVDWTDEDVWEYLNDVKKVEHCCLYDEGWTRIGCIGCPMQSIKQREQEFERWPAYKRNYIKAIERMIANNQRREAEKLALAAEGRDEDNGGWCRQRGRARHPENGRKPVTGEEGFEIWIKTR